MINNKTSPLTKFLIVLLILIIVGCLNPVETKKVYDEHNRPISVSSSGEVYRVSEWEHKKHTYILISNAHGSGITHAGHCKCQEK